MSKHDRRIAVQVAALAMTSGNWTTIEEFWALTVYAERYIERGAKGTRHDFGPKKPRKATILRLLKP